jgi:hypothetical protein
MMFDTKWFGKLKGLKMKTHFINSTLFESCRRRKELSSSENVVGIVIDLRDNSEGYLIFANAIRLIDDPN